MQQLSTSTPVLSSTSPLGCRDPSLSYVTRIYLGEVNLVLNTYQGCRQHCSEQLHSQAPPTEGISTELHHT